jgi:tRNA pseudouridine13 synthase
MQDSAMSTPRAFGNPLCSATFRQSAVDFIVDESLIFEPDGAGEHVYLHVRKTNTNTQWLAQELASYANIKRRDISYAGLKDRHAVTSQWFSLLLHKDNEPDWNEFRQEGVEILEVTRHRTKLRPGMAKRNHFVITLYDIHCSEQALQQRLELVEQQGVPNYYGEQRFGRDASNLEQVKLLFEGKIKVKSRNKKGLYLSSARSYLFNKVLAERVRLGNWATPIAGDCMMLDGTNSFFSIDEPDDEIKSRVKEFDIHPTGPLWGNGELPTRHAAHQLESEILHDEQLFQTGLCAANMKMDRRSLRMKPKSLAYERLSPTTIRLSFDLTAGQYATTLLHELFVLESSDSAATC